MKNKKQIITIILSVLITLAVVFALLFGIKIYPVLLAVFYVIMVVALKCFINRLKKQGRYDANI